MYNFLSGLCGYLHKLLDYHFCQKYNLNPENEGESERVRGVIFFGFGSQLQSFKGNLGAAAAHSDCIMKNATVTIDDKILLKNNKFFV